jgi:hypothetical protein
MEFYLNIIEIYLLEIKQIVELKGFLHFKVLENLIESPKIDQFY